jgi:DNA-binding winged helix-turn-helix (wHTH) protein
MKPEHLSGVTASPSPGGKRSARTTTGEDTFVQSPEVRPTAMPTSESTTFSERSPLVEAPALAGFHSDEGRRDLQSPDTDQLILNNGSISAGATASEISFGPFRLLPAQLLLLEGDKPVPLGTRALHILMVFLERPGELITKQELMAGVWPNLFVESATLTVHISALRRALRDGRDGNRFIINIRGRGYCFVTPIR